MEYNWTAIRDYRQKEIAEVAGFVNDIIKGNQHPEYFRGAVDMFRKIILLPETLCAEEEREFIDSMMSQDFATFDIEYLRNAVKE